MIVRYLLLFACMALARVQGEERGFISVSDSSKVKVILECGAKFMKVQLLFNETTTPSFSDFIIVGLTNDPQCERAGSGETKYIVEIPLMSDPCGTKMKGEGVFENRIRIAANKFIVLGSDELVTVRCLYGPPKVQGFSLPPTDYSLDSTTAISLVGARDPDIGIAGVGVNGNKKNGNKLEIGHIYLIIFLVLFLALLFLLCGCLYFFFKKRKLRVERRKNLVLAVPPGADLQKMGLGSLWWSGKGSVSNDALLSHDYMLSSGAGREGGLSVSTDYAPDSSPSHSSGSPGHPAGVYVQDPRGFHRGPVPPPGVLFAPSIEETLRSHSTTTVHHHHRGPPGPVYAHVDMAAKKGKRAEEVSPGSHLDLRLQTDHYASPERDDGSVSTLEGDERKERREGPGAATVRADVHAAAVLRQAGGAESVEDRDWTEEYVRVVHAHRGLGRNKMTEQEISRWRHLVENDANVQEILRRSKNVEDLEQISSSPQYAGLFPPEKWHLIIQSLAHANFMRRLNTVIDSAPSRSDEDSVAHKRRYVKKSEAGPAGRVGGTPDSSLDTEERVFTRDSYFRLTETTESRGAERTEDDAAVTRAFQAVEFTRDCATNETVESVPQVRGISASPSSATPPPPSTLASTRRSDVSSHAPTLAVYKGGLPGSAKAPAASTFSMNSAPYGHGTSTYDNWQESPDEL